MGKKRVLRRRPPPPQTYFEIRAPEWQRGLMVPAGAAMDNGLTAFESTIGTFILERFGLRGGETDLQEIAARRYGQLGDQVDA